MDRNDVIVISGGGTGIGAAIARAVAGDGAHVLLLGRRQDVVRSAAEAIEAEHGAGAASWLGADLSDPDQVATVADHVRTTHGTIHGIVNNAGGGTGPGGSSLAELKAAWHHTFDVNVMTAVLLTSALAPMLRRPGGRIVNIGSMSAKFGAGGAAYVAAKGAINAWTLSLTYEHGKDGITANAVIPGYTPDTELFGGGMPAAVHEAIVARFPFGRPGAAADVAGAVRWLLSPDASFVTMQLIEVAGGVLPPAY